jgi:UDP-glucuronate 4-epimerase
MNILITGVAGFIGFSLANSLLKKNYNIYGIDNYDIYYNPSIKKKRVPLKYNEGRNKSLDKSDESSYSSIITFNANCNT